MNTTVGRDDMYSSRTASIVREHYGYTGEEEEQGNQERVQGWIEDVAAQELETSTPEYMTLQVPGNTQNYDQDRTFSKNAEKHPLGSYTFGGRCGEPYGARDVYIVRYPPYTEYQRADGTIKSCGTLNGDTGVVISGNDGYTREFRDWLNNRAVLSSAQVIVISTALNIDDNDGDNSTDVKESDSHKDNDGDGDGDDKNGDSNEDGGESEEEFEPVVDELKVLEMIREPRQGAVEKVLDQSGWEFNKVMLCTENSKSGPDILNLY
jgi:hypothetical protein